MNGNFSFPSFFEKCMWNDSNKSSQLHSSNWVKQYLFQSRYSCTKTCGQIQKYQPNWIFIQERLFQSSRSCLGMAHFAHGETEQWMLATSVASLLWMLAKSIAVVCNTSHLQHACLRIITNLHHWTFTLLHQQHGKTFFLYVWTLNKTVISLTHFLFSNTTFNIWTPSFIPSSTTYHYI